MSEVTELQESLAAAQQTIQEQQAGMARLQEQLILRDARDFVTARLVETELPGVTRQRLVRQLAANPPTADGALDATFAPGTGANDAVYALKIDRRGRPIIGGAFGSVNDEARAYLARLGGGGALDMTFDPGAGADSYVHAMAIQPDGKILIAGDFTSYDGVARTRLARVNAYGYDLFVPLASRE